MTSHEHNRDLIMALAAGGLDAAAARDAEAVIATCTNCRHELDLQRTALAAVAAVPPAAMTELEAARFRRDLDTALGHERTVIATPAPARRFNWAPVFSVAAILLALVLIAPALQLVGGGGDDSGADLVSLQDLEDDAASDDAAGAQPEAAPQEELSRDSFTAAEAPASTAAAAADEADGDTAGGTAETLDDQLLGLWEALGENDLVAGDRSAALAYGIVVAAPEDDTCVLEGAQLLTVDASNSYLLGELSTVEGLRLVTVHLDGDETIVIAQNIATCEIVGRAP